MAFLFEVGGVANASRLRAEKRSADFIQCVHEAIMKKALTIRSGLLEVGGVDGTRTRDPRRDRPVF